LNNQTFYTLQIFNALFYSYLQFEWIEENPEPSTEKKKVHTESPAVPN